MRWDRARGMRKLERCLFTVIIQHADGTMRGVIYQKIRHVLKVRTFISVAVFILCIIQQLRKLCSSTCRANGASADSYLRMLRSSAIAIADVVYAPSRATMYNTKNGCCKILRVVINGIIPELSLQSAHRQIVKHCVHCHSMLRYRCSLLPLYVSGSSWSDSGTKSKLK